MSKKQFSLFIMTNSPGELISWVDPVVATFKTMNPHSKVTILLLPCQYSSGMEFKVARSIKGVDDIYMPGQTIKLLFSFPWRTRKYLPGAILYLGGDPLYAQLSGIKYKLPVYGYTEHNRSLGFMFKKIFYKDIDGDLMIERAVRFQADRQRVLEKYGLENRKYCLFFCGSRKQHFMNLIPLMRDAVNLIKSEDKNFSPVLLVSPFISDQDFKAAGDEFDLSDFIVLRGDSLELMSISDFLVTIPGTNNAEAMYMNLPMLVFLPLNRPELIILDGVAGLIGNLPFAGRIIKTIIVMIMAKRKMYYSLPNRVAGKGIVPEIIGVVDAEIIAKEICKYYYDKDQLKKIKKNLSCFNNNKEIAKKICLTVLEDLQDV